MIDMNEISFTFPVQSTLDRYGHILGGILSAATLDFLFPFSYILFNFPFASHPVWSSGLRAGLGSVRLMFIFILSMKVC